MKTGLLFGSFNPIHIGHLIIANQFLEFTELEEIWFVVSPHNPLKNEDSLIDARLRLKMVEAAVSANKKMKACDVEFKLPKPSYTIDTMAYFKKKYPWYDFFILMGSDSFNDLNKWKEYKKILANYPVYVYQRLKHPVRKLLAWGDVTIFEFPYIDISATYIRQMLKDNKSVQFLVPDKSLKILYEQKYPGRISV